MYGRNFAEHCLKPLFKGILYTLGKHQQKALTLRLRNKWVDVDPRAWTTEYDMTINVGLGTGTKDQQLMHLQALGADLMAAGQSPFGGQLLDAKKVYNFIEKKAELCGFKDVSIFVNDPEQQPPPPPPQPPVPLLVAQMKEEGETQRAQMKEAGEMQRAQMEAGQDQQKIAAQAQADTAEREATLAMDRMRAEMEAQLEVFKAQLKHESDMLAAHLNAMVRQQAVVAQSFKPPIQ